MFIGLLSWCVQKLPHRFVLRVARGLGTLWYYLIPIRCSVAKSNVRRTLIAQGHKVNVDKVVLESCRQLTMYALEMLRWNGLEWGSLERDCREFRGLEHYQRAREKGRSPVLVSIHQGPFEATFAIFAQRGWPQNSFYKSMSNKAVESFWLGMRERQGLQQLPSKNAREAIEAVVKRGETLIFFCDQHLPAHRALVCSFFGQLAATTPAPVRLALKYDLEILPVHTHRCSDDPTKHIIEILPPFELQGDPQDDDFIFANTERLNRVFEAWIVEHPEQWLWHHKRFKVHDDPSGWVIPQSLENLSD